MSQSPCAQRIELVVARFNEPLNWLRRVPPGIRITVYDKGEAGLEASPEADAPIDNKTPRFNLARLPNIGRESHTYLHHIVARYETLAPLTVFCQGKPFDHAFDFHHTLRQLAQEEDANIVSRIYARTLIDADVVGAQSLVGAQNCVAQYGFAPLGHIVDTDDARGERLFRDWSKNEDRRALDVAGFHQTLFGSPALEEYTFRLGAQFIATNACVRRRSRAYYERARQVSIDFPDAAHCFERAWPLVFDVPNPDLMWLGNRQAMALKPLRRMTISTADA